MATNHGCCGSGGGATTFLALTDTPDDYTDAADKIVRVNPDGDGLVFEDVIPETHGGTGQNTYVAGDVLYSDLANSLARLPIGTEGQALQVNGGVPAWQTPATGVTTFIGLSDTPANFTGAALDIVRVNAAADALEFVSVVPETAGGTGQSTWTTGDIPYSDSADSLDKLGIGTVGQVLTSDGSIPQWEDATSGASTFVELTDTPANYVGSAQYALRVNAAGDGIEFVHALPENAGGTGQFSYLTGDLLYANAGDSLARRTIGSAGQVLTVSAGVPVWADASAGDITGGTNLGAGEDVFAQKNGANLEFKTLIGGTQIDLDADGSEITINSTAPSEFVELSDSPGTYTGAALDIVRVNAAADALEFISVVPETAGGTGQSSFTTGDILYASAANTLSKRAAGTNGHILTMSGGVPVWAESSGGGGGTELTGSAGSEALVSTGTGSPSGNARGGVAVDLQNARGSADQVASGYGATIAGGQYNKAASGGSTVGGGLLNDATGGVGNNTVAGGGYNEATGGNATVGGGDDNVASGTASTIGGGQDNLSSGAESNIAGGKENQASAQNASVGGGRLNEATGYAARVGGGYGNEASGDYSEASGGYATANHDGESARGNTIEADAGQRGEIPLAVDTTDATPTLATVFGNLGNLTIGTDETMSGEIEVTARQQGAGGGDMARWRIPFLIGRVGTGNPSISGGGTGLTPDHTIGSPTDWTVDVEAEASAKSLKVTVTGEASHNIRWVATVYYTKSVYA